MMQRILLLCCLFPLALTAQQNEFDWRLGIYTGIMGYSGDLGYKFIDPNDRLVNFFDNLDYLSYGVTVEGRMSNTLSLGMMYTQGQFVANDRTIDWSGDLRTDNPDFLRSLNVRTDIRDLGLYLTLHTDNGNTLSQRAFFSPYFKIGVGVTFFDTYGDLFYGPDEDQRYYYWDDFTVRDRPPGSSGAQIIEQDGVFETELRPLRTEGKDYADQAISLSGAFGFKFRLGDRVNLNLELLARMVTTDYLDDVSGAFLTEYDSDLQRYAANPADIPGPDRGDRNDLGNDIYTFTSLSLHYNFGRRTRAFTVPAIAVSSLMAAPPATRAASSMGRDTMALDTLQTVVVDSTALLIADSLAILDDSLRLRADSLQYVVDSLQRRIRILMAPADSLLADSLRRVADSLYMRADSLYPVAAYDIRDSSLMNADSVFIMSDDSTMNARLLTSSDSLSQTDSLYAVQNRMMADSLMLLRDSLARLSSDDVLAAAPPDSLAQEQIADLEAQLDELSDSLLITRTQLEAAQVYEPLPDTIPRQQRVAIYDDELEDRRQEVEELQVTADELTPDQQARLDEMERQMDEYEGMLRRMERSMDNNDDEYEELEKEIKKLRKQLNITTGVGAAAGITAAVAGGGKKEKKKDRKAREEMEAQMRSMQTQIDSLNGVIATGATIDTLSPDSARVIMSDLPMDTVNLYNTEGVTNANDSLRALYAQQRNQAQQLQAQRDSLMAELEKARRQPGLQRRQAVYFPVNSSTLSAPARQTVENVAAIVKQYPDLRVYLEGYTDPSGSAEYNRALSQRRTQSVRDYLVELGLSADHIIPVPQGEDSTTPDPTLGRRVDLILRGQEE